jgi:hypothetical protein
MERREGDQEMKIIDKIKCFFAHNWLYYSPGPRNGKWHRECQRCGKRMHGRYDMMYGATDWENGWD